MTPEERMKQQKKEEALYASSLRVPHRPPWNTKMSVEDLDANERQAFLIWRRSLASIEENEKLVLTPFEKNLDIQRQLWRVLERSDLLVMVVDARDPLFYHCPDLEIIYDRVTERSRGFAFVTMSSAQEAKEASRMFDGTQVGGRTVKVNLPEVPRGGEREVMGPKIHSSYRSFVESPHKIYAGNLNWELTSQGLGDAFAEQPGLLSAKVIYDRETGRSKGFGFVTFASAEDADSALDAMNGVEVEGRPMRLNIAVGRTTPASPVVESIETDLHGSEMQSSVGAY